MVASNRLGLSSMVIIRESPGCASTELVRLSNLEERVKNATSDPENIAETANPKIIIKAWIETTTTSISAEIGVVEKYFNKMVTKMYESAMMLNYIVF